MAGQDLQNDEGGGVVKHEFDSKYSAGGGDGV